jgi:phosphinothricin acetyltransferase
LHGRRRAGRPAGPAGIRDAEGICAIYNVALAERSSTFEAKPRAAADFSGRIAEPRHPLLVGDAGQGVLGWASLAPYSTRACYSGVGEFSVYVSPAARGQGLGTALTEALAAAAVDLGFRKMIGKLFTDNLASIRLVERCGFSRVGYIAGTGNSTASGETCWSWSG